MTRESRLEYEKRVNRVIDHIGQHLGSLLGGMLRAPLYALDADRGFATVYTAVYRPAEAAVEYVWPGHRWRQSFDRFEAGTYTHEYRPPAPPGSPRVRRR